MSCSFSLSSLTQLRAAFGRCVDCAEKQIGLRRVASARLLISANPAMAEDLYREARWHLAYAQARTRTGREG